MQYEIKALGLGGILDQAVSLVKNHLGLLLGVTCVLLIPFGLVQGFLHQAMMPVMPDIATMTQAQANAYNAGNLQAQMFVLPLLIIQLFVIIPITNAAVIFAISNKYLGKPVTVGSAMGRVLGLIGPLLLTAILNILAMMGGFILFIIPGFIFMFWFILWSHVVVIEGLSGTAALGRSKQLMKGNIGDVFVLGILVGIINWVFAFGAAMIPQAHLQVVATAFAQAMVTIFGAAAMVVFYFSCRCKFENFDLTLLAQSIGGDSSEDEVVFDE